MMIQDELLNRTLQAIAYRFELDPPQINIGDTSEAAALTSARRMANLLQVIQEKDGDHPQPELLITALESAESNYRSHARTMEAVAIRDKSRGNTMYSL